jgi:hypothetical protein
LFALALAAVAHAQPQQAAQLNRFERQLEEIQRQTRLSVASDFSPLQRALVDYGAYAAFNFYAVDDQLGHSHILRESELIGYARVNVDDVHQFFFRARTAYRDWNSGDDFDGEGDVFTSAGADWVDRTIERAVYRFDLQRYLAAYEGQQIDSNLIIQGGRQLVHWANGLTLSEEIDGGVFTLSHGPLSLDVVVGLRRQATYDIDPFRPYAAGEDLDTDRAFYGGMLNYAIHPKHTVFVYGLLQDDQNDDDTIVDPVSGNTVHFDYESWYIGGGASGAVGDRVLYAVEAVYEGGESLSRPDDTAPATFDQTHEDIEAFAADIRLDYLFLDANRTRLQLETTLASGDDDRDRYTNSALGGNLSGTDDQAFNGFGLINSGLAFAPVISNLVMVRGGVSTFPLPNTKTFSRLQVGLDLFVFSKFDSDAPISEPTDDSGFLGWETDLFANWQITSDLSLALRYGCFVPGDAMGDVPNGQSTSSSVRHFFYSGLTLGF